MATGDREKIRGDIDEAKGKAKRAAGEIGGDENLKGEGSKDKLKGKIERAKGRVKNATDELKK